MKHILYNKEIKIIQMEYKRIKNKNVADKQIIINKLIRFLYKLILI